MRLLKPRYSASKSVENALSDHFTGAEVEAIDRFGTVLDMANGSRILTEGDLGREAVVILSGSADVCRAAEVVAQVGAGDLVGERSILLSELRNASVVARSEMRVVVFSRLEFKSLLDACPSLATKMKMLLETRV